MTITVSFLVTVGLILVAGLVFRRWDESHHLRFVDQVGTARAVPALTRVEARRLALHPAFLITLGFVATITIGLLITSSSLTVEADRMDFFTFLAVPLGALALVAAAHRNVCRSRREHTDELFASMPTSPRAHTTAFLLACLGPVPIAFAYLFFTLLAADPLWDAPVPMLWPLVASVATTILLAVVGGGVVGVFLARWLPTTAAALIGIAAIIWLNNGPDNHHPNFRWLRVAVEVDLGGRYDIVPPAVWRVAFIAALVGLGACLAMWSHPTRRSLIIATAACVIFVAVSGWVISRPPTAAEVDRVVADLGSPTDAQHCETRSGVRYCVYPGTEAWIDNWSPAVDAVLARVPERVRPDAVQVLQRESIPILEAPVEYNGAASFPYPSAVVERLDPTRAWAADGAVHPPLQFDTAQPDWEVAFGVASLAVGLPPSASWSEPGGCMAAGQARLVLAMWLAGSATDSTATALADHASWVEQDDLADKRVAPNTHDDYENRSASRDGYQAVVGAAGTGADVIAAHRLVRGGAELDQVLDDHWEELTDPATGSARLFELAGVEAPTANRNVAEGGTCS